MQRLLNALPPMRLKEHFSKLGCGCCFKWPLQKSFVNRNVFWFYVKFIGLVCIANRAFSISVLSHTHTHTHTVELRTIPKDIYDLFEKAMLLGVVEVFQIAKIGKSGKIGKFSKKWKDAIQPCFYHYNTYFGLVSRKNNDFWQN